MESDENSDDNEENGEDLNSCWDAKLEDCPVDGFAAVHRLSDDAQFGLTIVKVKSRYGRTRGKYVFDVCQNTSIMSNSRKSIEILVASSDYDNETFMGQEHTAALPCTDSLPQIHKVVLS